MMDFVCPKDPRVWDGKNFTPCFADLVFGFGANVVTIVAIAMLAVTQRNLPRERSVKACLFEKVLSRVLPALGAFISLCEIVLLMKNGIEGHIAENHYWIYRCSQLTSWMVILLVSHLDYWLRIFSNIILCCWWILKLFLEIPVLLRIISSLEVIPCLMEGAASLVGIMFGIFVITIRTWHASNEKRGVQSIEDPLLSCTSEIKEGETENQDRKCCSCWELLAFKFVSKMMDVGVTKQLDFEDLVDLPGQSMPSQCHSALLDCWIAENNMHNSDPSLFRAMYHAYGWPYFRLGLLKALNDSVNFVGPLLLNKLIQFLQQGSGHSYGYFLALSLGFTSIFKSFLDTQYSFRLMKLRLMMRSSIMALVYRKCLFISLAERSKFSEGEVQNFMSIDADRVVNLCNSLHDAWSLPLQIGLALYLLYTQVKFAFISGVALTIFLIPVNKWISTLIANATEKMMKHKDERIRSSAELLTHIRTIKMFSWEDIFSKRLMERREMEVKHLSTRKYLDAWCVFFWATTPTLFSLCTFGVFTLMGHSLDAATVFTCVALFNTLISPLNSFPWVINGLIDAMISTRRLSKYLSCHEHSSECKPCSDGDLQKHDQSSSFSGSYHTAVIFKSACAAWSSSYQVKHSMVLNNITLDIPRGMLVAITGEVAWNKDLSGALKEFQKVHPDGFAFFLLWTRGVLFVYPAHSVTTFSSIRSPNYFSNDRIYTTIGSGKSSLLNSILGEMQMVHGIIHSSGSIAYVPQVPWILSGSIRDNILLGDEFDSRRYEEVLQACTLDVDVSIMVDGDLTFVREKGVNLSGGQRARLALARAVYKDSEVYLLDDILSAVDSRVASWILQRAILGPLMNNKTRLLCTHNTQAIASADFVVIMERGQVKWVGSSSNFLASPHSKMLQHNNQHLSSLVSLAEGKKESSIPSGNDNVTTVEERNDENDDTVEARKEGRVELSIYKSYGRFAGWPVVILICISASLMQTSRNGNDLWLSYWVDSTTGSDNTVFYLIILSIFGCMNSILTLARAFSFAYGGLRAAIHVHSALLIKLVNAPILFFDQNPSGRILNRLSSDLYTIDDSLPFILNILLANFFSLLGIIIVLSYSQIFFMVLLFPLWYIYSKLQFYYRSTSRELRRLDSVSRSPIYSSFTETLDGSSTIRAFKKEEMFMGCFLEHVKLYQQTTYSEQTSSLWLSLRLQLLAAFIILFIALMAVVGGSQDLPLSFGTPGLIGLSLSYAAPMVSLLSSFLSSFTETEKEMVSIERVAEYMDIPQEQLYQLQPLLPNWPMLGQIVFEHVTLHYRPSLPPALDNVSFTIEAGMQVGIVGRTGAGKSSILNALFLLTPISSGRILVDGLNIDDVDVRDLRSHFAIVPQRPFLFEGSLRENLDPSSVAPDARIWEALEKCHIKKEVESVGGLDIHVKENGLPFSVGQQQLICLARAIIKSSKILCLDECTASVDTQTALLIQNTIFSECKGMTVLTIAHRISTVLNMDKILVLDRGTLVEQGNPQDLLKNERSIFSSFARASTM